MGQPAAFGGAALQGCGLETGKEAALAAEVLQMTFFVWDSLQLLGGAALQGCGRGPAKMRL